MVTKMHMKKIFPIGCAGILLAGCTSFLQLDQPQDQLIRETVFASNSTAQTALNGLYADLMTLNNTLVNGGLSAFCGMTADELVGRVKTAARLAFENNQLTAQTTDNEYSLWREGYVRIYQANALIEGCRDNDRLDPELRARIMGEALFIRALLHFYLVNLYGDVPLITTTDSEANALSPRAPAGQVYQRVLEDLSIAEGLLAGTPYTTHRSRPGVVAVTAMQARVNLYLGNWQAAAAYATAVIDRPDCALEPLDAVFRYQSREVIWQLYPVHQTFKATAEAQSFLPAMSASSLPTLLVSEQLQNRFEPGDSRASTWISEKTYLGVTYPFPHKYRIRTGGDVREEYNVLFRLAEQFLIRAEARAHIGDLDGALQDLNAIRERAGLLPVWAADRSAFFPLLTQERAVEFFAECGHRWFDLKRWGLADAVLEPLKGDNWQPSDIWFPIPQSELEVNPFLIQNGGY